ncbi:MAG: type II toxin-antitoxin system VapC family toxin [Cyanobacteria bacterium]|uniref:type II toxin-antitoxin system VapC family toxin n=1 Tax=Geminocystis herdmanii TaxID=669359 RepID=UPI00034923E6|nr:type II toxin-antitoxin system VapC family toxin [Geminocystis herdmanii]NCO73834.1 type II toxin-antitoxin system VapC family toxin [Cyanobacteria bacterium CG_2015-16_32_12]NCO76803.1 type II toxin-antitoxin system VapC family toxin [Cyanobacteria bacterium CG_2015-22_32_23]NCQ04007.1 type II toxin-antitoxin system VapC family toxin [Cyanobacteria bacterium CG_2015-09_32_10]NCQ40976.1 type II toxin-antitoxin system VapC family toxin [Cyanobacteria bacterium CG_2015-04_32_10]NCS85440.1 typ
MILCDTNILIELYKNNPQVIGELNQIGVKKLAISIITQSELYYGAINKAELNKIKKHLTSIRILPIDLKVSNQFIQLMETYSLSHKLTIPDALIASTALIYQFDLYTLNQKDFRFIEGLKLYQSIK